MRWFRISGPFETAFTSHILIGFSAMRLRRVEAVEEEATIINEMNEVQ